MVKAPLPRSGPGVATVLVVDDNYGNRLALRGVLEPLGQHLEVVETGEAALKYMMNHEVAAILLDAHLPGMSGFEVAESLRKRERTRDVPILFITGTARDQANAGYAQGAFDYIVKPYDPDSLRGKVSALVKLYLQRREAEAQRDAAAASDAESRQERAEVYGLLAQAPALIARLKGPEHVFEFANAAYMEAIGNRNPVGKPLRRALPELEGQGFYELLDRVYETGEPFRAEEVQVKLARGANGALEDAFVNFVYQPTRNSFGKVDGILVHATEVTAQALARQRVEALSVQLREREEQFRTLAEAIPQQVFTALPDGTIEFVNHKLVQNTGRSLEEIVREGWTPGVHADDQAKTARAWTDALEQGKPFEVEHRLRRASDGEYRWHLSRALPFRDQAGRIVRWHGTVTDIHDQKLATRDLERINAFQQQILAIVGHDLRNPLNAILGSAQILLHKGGASADPGLARIARSAVRMRSMLNDIVDFTRARMDGALPVSPQPCRLGDLAREVVEELATVYPTRQIKLEVQDACEGFWDPSRLAQLMSNLVANALQYSPAELPVQVAVGCDDGEARISVTNGGTPIPAESLSQIFEPFRRGLPSEAQGVHLGLGLFVIDQVARAHGGAVTVTSDEQRGTCFTVRLPRQKSGAQG